MYKCADDVHEVVLCTQHKKSFAYILACVADSSEVCLLMIFMKDHYVQAVLGTLQIICIFSPLLKHLGTNFE